MSRYSKICRCKWLCSGLTNTPPNYSAETNAQIAAAYAQSHSILESYQWFYSQVKNSGPWDYKQQGSQYEELGNFNYGVAGTAMGIPAEVLLRMAGWAQTRAGTSTDGWWAPLGSAPYGDDPNDQQLIKDGIQWAKDNGLAPTPPLDILPPSRPIDPAISWWESFIDDVFGSTQSVRELIGEFEDKIEDILNDLFLRARDFVESRDPLAFDLDGDGIETVGIDGASSILFDHDGDGIRTGTGWLKGDDAFLVLDRDGNGQIDNGSELFGVDTLKSDGTKAIGGLDALADLDSNHDGVFDAGDAHFENVQLWRDLNQDGISQANELSTLAENGIVSIDLAGQKVSTNLGNGNTQTGATTYTRTDGSQGAAGDLALSTNSFYRQFEDAIALSPDIAGLPNMQGSGAVRDLREAAQLSPDLGTQLTALVEAGNIGRDAYREKIVELIDTWAFSADFSTSLETARTVSAQNDSAMQLHYLPPGVGASEADLLPKTSTS